MKQLPAPKENGKEKVKDPRKSGILKTFVASLLMIGLGFVMMLFPEFSNDTVAMILGCSMIGVGLLLVAVSLLNWNIMGIPELLIGVGLIVVGILVVVNTDYIATTFLKIIAIFVGFHGLLSLMDGSKLKKMDRNHMPHIILGLTMLVVTLILIFIPADDKDVYWLVRVMGALVILCGLGNLILRSKFYLSLPKARLTFDRTKLDG